MMAKRYARLTEPLVRDNGVLREATWDEALDRAAAGFASHRGNAFGMFSCSKATNETNYVAQKFARTVQASNNIDSCNRT
jgi:formate dehydrogenase major subunit